MQCVNVLILVSEYFAAFAQDKPDHVKLYYHGSLKDDGWDLLNLAAYYNIEQRLLLTSPTITPADGVDKHVMRMMYSAADVGMSTNMGEGWGLTAHERICGVPMILPCHSAYAEWALDTVDYVPCTSRFAGIKQLNTMGLIDR